MYLTEEDIVRLAVYLGLPQPHFEARFVYRTTHLRRLRVPRHANCAFLVDGGCSVHLAKPMQCASFPFWPEILDSYKSWGQAGKRCPGIGKGELVNIELAQKAAEEMRAAHPGLYR